MEYCTLDVCKYECERANLQVKTKNQSDPSPYYGIARSCEKPLHNIKTHLGSP